MQTVLIVDDSAAVRSLVTVNLKRLPNVAIVESANGEDALKALSQKIDLVITDINMPGMNGLDLVVEIRKSHPKEQLPILIISTRGEELDVMRGLELGANDYLSKPIRAQDIRQKVALLLNIQTIEAVHAPHQ